MVSQREGEMTGGRFVAVVPDAQLQPSRVIVQFGLDIG
jgi:hypothetical protein